MHFNLHSSIFYSMMLNYPLLILMPMLSGINRGKGSQSLSRRGNGSQGTSGEGEGRRGQGRHTWVQTMVNKKIQSMEQDHICNHMDKHLHRQISKKLIELCEMHDALIYIIVGSSVALPMGFDLTTSGMILGWRKSFLRYSDF